MIITRRYTGNFAVIPNSTANDQRLKAEALGVLIYLVAKPHDWKVRNADIRKRFGIGRNKVYNIINELVEAGYVEKVQHREADSPRFADVEYTVYDCPCDKAETVADEATGIVIEADDSIDIPALPGSENGKTSIKSRVPVLGIPETGKILKTYSNKTLQGDSVSDETGVSPSTSSEIWGEGIVLLGKSPGSPHRSIIGRWLKQVGTVEGKAKLLAIIRSALNAGTGDPVSYVTAALNKEFPPRPSPTTFDAAAWKRKAQAAIKTQAWEPSWGPPPGKSGCLMPIDLQTPELIRALNTRRIAA